VSKTYSDIDWEEIEECEWGDNPDNPDEIVITLNGSALCDEGGGAFRIKGKTVVKLLDVEVLEDEFLPNEKEPENK